MSGLLLMGVGGSAAAAPEPGLTEHVQNGDVPVAGVLTLPPNGQAINTLAVALPAGPATLKY